MGVGITKTPEGVQALKSMATSLRDTMEKNKMVLSQLDTAYQTNRGGLAHEKDIEKIIEDIKQTNSTVEIHVKLLANRIESLASRLSQWLNGSLGGGK